MNWVAYTHQLPPTVVLHRLPSTRRHSKSPLRQSRLPSSPSQRVSSWTRQSQTSAPERRAAVYHRGQPTAISATIGYHRPDQPSVGRQDTGIGERSSLRCQLTGYCEAVWWNASDSGWLCVASSGCQSSLQSRSGGQHCPAGTKAARVWCYRPSGGAAEDGSLYRQSSAAIV